MKTIQRWLSLVLVIVMIFSAVPLNAIDLDTSETSSIESLSTENTEQESSEISSTETSEDFSESTSSETITESLELSTDEVTSTKESSEETTSEKTASSETNTESSTENNLIAEINDITDSEETPEESVDNWSLDVVFYDSTVDGGTTPLTEINWDASDGGYGKGEQRTIKVQINYKNTNAVTTYTQGQLVITIPNLIYNTSYTSSAQWTSSILFGANGSEDAWKTSATINSETITFINAKDFTPSNSEGSIQIAYIITPKAETTQYGDGPTIESEKYNNYCTHNYTKSLQAKLVASAYNINSPNWPNSYTNNLTEANNYWIIDEPETNIITITFDPTSATESVNYDWIAIYDKNGTQLAKYGGTSFAGQTYTFDTNYIKITFRTDSSGTKKGFSAYIGIETAKSNEISLTYTRTYTHIWQKNNHDLQGFTAGKLSSMDGLPANCANYYWVRYEYTMWGISRTGSNVVFNTIGSEFKVSDILPEGCIFLNCSMHEVDLEDEFLKNVVYESYGSTNWKCRFYVGYPRSTYNEENGNLNITNTIDLHVKFETEEDFNIVDTASVSINLADFDFTYPDNLYSISKGMNCGSGKLYSDFMLKPNFTHLCYYCTYKSNSQHCVTGAKCSFSTNCYYTGNLLTIKYGDDLLYITDANNNYRKLTDEEYFFSYIVLPKITNYNNIEIPYNKYPASLYVRYAGEAEYTLYCDLSSYSKDNKIDFTGNKKIVSWYIQIEDSQEGLKLTQTSGGSNAGYHSLAGVHFKPKENISPEGNVYNFAFLQVFFKDENENLILQNEPSLDSYATITTQDNIAQYDLETYGTYVQRSVANIAYTEYSKVNMSNDIKAYKNISDAAQDNANEVFTNSNLIGFYMLTQEGPTLGCTDNYIQAVFIEHIEDYDLLTKYKIYDLLPKGMEIKETEEELINKIRGHVKSNTDYFKYLYDKNGSRPFPTEQDFINFIKAHSTIELTNNYNNTGRTKIEWTIDFTDTPLFNSYPSRSYDYGCFIGLDYTTLISYDNYLEYGNTYKNYVYVEGFCESSRITPKQYIYVKDNGDKDSEFIDMNNNNDTSEIMSYNYATTTITSVISTHQDVTTFVKTDYKDYSTGIVDASCSSEYKYKLRIKTGTANITNLTIYTSIEEAQPKRTRWKGEFLGIDTSYAKSKGYNVKTWYSENAIVDTLEKDTSWKEYIEGTTDKTLVKSLAFQYLDSNGSPAVLPKNSLTYVLINMKAPADDSIETLARMDCWTEWNALDEFGQPVDFITGINSNVVKVALPNSVKTDDLPSISLRFTKDIVITEDIINLVKTRIYSSMTNNFDETKLPEEIKEKKEYLDLSEWIAMVKEYLEEQATAYISSLTQEQLEQFAYENILLNKADEQVFKITLTSLTTNDDGTYNQVNGILSSTQGLVITQIPIGSYLLTEADDAYFDFVDFTDNNDSEIIIEGVTFEKTDQGYIITVDENLSETVEFNIKVTNKIEQDKHYESRELKQNWFNPKKKTEEDL